MRHFHQVRSWTFFLVGCFLACGSTWAGPVSYGIDVNTSSISGTTGSLDFQFNPGPLIGQTADVQIFNFSSDGSLVAANASTVGDVSGALPSTVTIDTANASYPLNEYFEGFTYGSRLHFGLSFYGPALVSPNGSAGGSLFAFSMFSDAAGTIPVLTSDTTYGLAFNISVNADGTTTVMNNSAFTSVPEPNGAIVMGLLLIALGMGSVGRRISASMHAGVGVSPGTQHAEFKDP